MGIARDEFYKQLQDDYKESGSSSAVYQYISKEHAKLVQQAIENSTCKKSNIIQIEYDWALLLSGKETSKQYINNLLHILKSRPVLYQDTTDSTSVEFLVDFISVGLNLDSTAKNILKQSKIKRKIQDKLIELVDNLDSEDKNIQNNIWLRFKQNGYTLKPYTKLSNITKIIIDRATNVEIKAFFYDAGYPLTAFQDRTMYNNADKPLVKNQSGSRRITREKIDKTLSLMDIYCEKKNYSLFSTNSHPSTSDCEKLFSLLVQGENQEVLIPLRVDVQTGCALYIIGKKHYECIYAEMKLSLKVQKFKHNRDACSYGILELYTPYDDNNTSLDHSVGYMLLNDFGKYSSFEDAENDYKEYCRNSLEDLREIYNLSLPEGCPSVFYKYSLASSLSITSEEYNETKREFDKEFEDSKNKEFDT